MVPPENENDILIHKLATIGVVRSFGPVGRREHFFSRLDMSPTSLQQVVEKLIPQFQICILNLTRIFNVLAARLNTNAM